MRFFYTAIEQLDLAAQQLHRTEPSYARFGLILVDNVVELVCHRKCKDEVDRDRLYELLGKPKYTNKEREKALDMYLDGKVNFVRKLGLLDEREADFVLACHEYRNELYHVGLRHDDIIYSIAWQYHEFACDLVRKLTLWVYMWSTELIVSDAVRRHAPIWGEGPARDFGAELASATRSLAASKPPMAHMLAFTLGNSLNSRISRLESALSYIVDENLSKLDASEVLKYIQHQRDHAGPAARYPGLIEDSSSPKLDDLRNYLGSCSWSPRYRNSPIPRWQSRAEALVSDADQLVALRKHDQLDDEMSYLGNCIYDAASYLEGYFQHMYDVARGK